MATNEDTSLPIHLTFKREINQRVHSLSPQKTVTGNVILFVPQKTIDKFNIPVYTGDIPMIVDRSKTTRILQNNKTANVSGYQVIKQGLTKNVRKIKILYGYNSKSYNRSTEYYLIDFPYFFNLGMIRDSLFLMFKSNAEGTRFMALPSQKKRDIFIGNKDMVNVALGNGKLIQGMNIDDSKFGNCTLVSVPTRRKQKLRQFKQKQ
jgi:hypothetical protein